MTYVTLLRASAHAIPLADESVQMCVTSPPYWSLRSYEGEQRLVWGGELGHEHEWVSDGRREAYAGTARWQHSSNGRGEEQPTEKRLRGPVTRKARPEAWTEIETGATCPCGAWYGALGLEPTPDLFVEHIVQVFREVRRVLRRDGTLWLNLGSSYSAHNSGNNGYDDGRTNRAERRAAGTPADYKPKDLVPIPWLVAIALQRDGWWLRSDVIWNKPNPMPGSQRDRPTTSHEYVFLLTKAERYYYDAEAIAEPITDSSLARITQATFDQQEGGEKDYRNGVNPNRSARQSLENLAKKQDQLGKQTYTGFNGRWSESDGPARATRTARTVWTIPTSPRPEAHFATFPLELARRCIAAGSAEGDLVLDPFMGSGTAGRAAVELGRRAVGLDLSETYLHEIAAPYIAQAEPFAAVADPIERATKQLDATGEGQTAMF